VYAIQIIAELLFILLDKATPL